MSPTRTLAATPRLAVTKPRTFGLAPPVSLGSHNALDVAITDVNRDGFPDVITSDLFALVVYLGQGSGTFAPASVSKRDPGFWRIARIETGDFNGDGLVDAAVLNESVSAFDDPRESVVLWAGKGDGTFIAQQPILIRGATSIAAADLDEDGITDLLVGRTSDFSISVLKGQSDGILRPAGEHSLLGNRFHLAITTGDINNDGHLDVVAVTNRVARVNADHLVTLLLGRGDGTFVFPARTLVDLLDAGETGGEVTLTDVNRDGRLDIIIANPVHGYIRITQHLVFF